jgi:hypothetical protein
VAGHVSEVQPPLKLNFDDRHNSSFKFYPLQKLVQQARQVQQCPRIPKPLLHSLHKITASSFYC